MLSQQEIDAAIHASRAADEGPTDFVRRIEAMVHSAKTVGADAETFSASQVTHSIQAFLDFGEQQYLKAQQGYFSGSGFAARCLRAHLTWLERPNS